MALIYFAAALGVILISYEIIKALRGDAAKIMRWFRLRRRGHNAYSPHTIGFHLALFIPKLLCRLGLHQYDVDPLQPPAPERFCQRWFCNEFGVPIGHR